MKLFTDENMLKTWSKEQLDIVETELKETRFGKQSPMSLGKFLRNYNKTKGNRGLYSVAEIPGKMRFAVKMPRWFHCGGFDTRLHGLVLWQSAGGTKSVIHNDGQDALNCQMDGRKHWIMWNPTKYGKKIRSKKYGWVSAREDRAFQKGYGEWAGRIDVENVNVTKFPGWEEMEWEELMMHPGDCLFNPSGWYHHVASPPEERSQSILFWWYRQNDFDKKDCDKKGPSPERNANDCSWGFDPSDNPKPTSCGEPKSTAEL
jgi:lysine-specific demethylase 8